MTERTRRRFLGSAAVVGTIAIAGCSSDGGGGGDGDGSAGGGSGPAQTSTIEMTDNLAFEPADVEVSAGTTVTWENVGNVGHTVTAYDDQIPSSDAYFASGEFDSQSAAEDGWSDGMEGNVPGGESYEHTFETTGEYGYYCIPHEGSMTGTITVVE